VRRHAQQSTDAVSSASPSRSLQVWSFLLPALKCALCPACLSIFGSLFAGARMGFVVDESLHGGIILVALVADFFILRAAMKHHRSRWPASLCAAGALLAVAGHFTNEAVEFAGFVLLMIAAILNLTLLRQHRKHGGACCVHDAAPHTEAPVPEYR
jgi:hypothetical protein